LLGFCNVLAQENVWNQGKSRRSRQQSTSHPSYSGRPDRIQ